MISSWNYYKLRKRDLLDRLVVGLGTFSVGAN
jgi:hypothetical protein